MVVVDSWGYGRFELAPWNYFEDQVVKDVASYFGVSGVEWYFVAGSLALLNPLFFVWFAIVMQRGWGDRFSRSVACGIAVFFVVHSLTPHKELRFLVPRLVQYKMSLKGGVIPTQDEPGGNLGKVD